MNFLVTGNRGFVGSKLAETIEGYGYTSVGLDKLDEYPTKDVLTEFILKNKIHGVFHLGARPFIPDCYGDGIDRVIESNISFTGDLLIACHRTGVKRLVYMSTSEVYGNVKKLPINEKTPINPLSTYAASKFAAESLCRSFSWETGLDVSVLRQFNIYGPGDTHPRIIPKLMQAAKHGNMDVKTGNLNVTRDFSYVYDVAHALVNVMMLKRSEYPPKYASMEDAIFVHGSGTETSMRELVKLISESYGVKLSPVCDETFARPRDVRRLCADRKLYDAFFSRKKQKRMSLEDGLEATIRWYENHDWPWETGYE